MTTISVPLNIKQAEFIEFLVEGGRAANKADAVRKAIDLLAEEEAIASIMRADQEFLDGKILRGDPRKLIKKF